VALQKPEKKHWAPSSFFLVVLFFIFGGTACILLIGSSFEANPFRMLIAFMLFIAAASIIARPVVYILTKKTGGLFYPQDKGQSPPAYSPAEARRMKGDYGAAMELFDALVSDHPQEIRAWVSMAEIALDNLNDPAKAKFILDRGLAVLTKESHKIVLQKTFDEHFESLGRKADLR
jgi:hypothetical protein